jgi:hypothetical protein
MNLPPPKVCQRIFQLHAMLGSPNSNEAEAARAKLIKLLTKHGLTWNDLAAIIAAVSPATSTPPPDPRDANVSDPYDQPNAPTPADTVHAMLHDYVALGEHEYVAVTLWIIHSHIFAQFMVTPRLLLISPAPDCGKTTLLDVIGRLAARCKKSDNITAAVIYHHVHTMRSTLLIDEADNLDLSAKAALRAVLNSGHRRGGSIDRLVRGHPQAFSVFGPVALGSLELLTQPLMRRSIIIRLARHDGSRPLRQFDADDCGDLDLVYGHIRSWLRRTTISRQPEMPAGMHGRQADNWRPLIAIADACGPAWGTSARDAAAALSRAHNDEAPAIVLLRHIRQIFDARGDERLAGKVLVHDLLELDEMWSEWRGQHGNEYARKVTQGELARLLAPFGIRPRTIWPLNRSADSRSSRGYHRSWFEQAWRSYCATADTATQPSKVIPLPRR